MSELEVVEALVEVKSAIDDVLTEIQSLEGLVAEQTEVLKKIERNTSRR